MNKVIYKCAHGCGNKISGESMSEYREAFKQWPACSCRIRVDVGNRITIPKESGWVQDVVILPGERQ